MTEGKHSLTRRASLSAYVEWMPSERFKSEKNCSRNVTRWLMPPLMLMGSA